ncbi:LpxA family transferase [Ulvibacterium sp.]|uniref:LpxA family transferase n=1 Tax=Ulvibacterium sp. TaxID=2665914 RepID=UPI002625A740|nr:LpxA family transferase [Ulvibacterium sp.]
MDKMDICAFIPQFYREFPHIAKHESPWHIIEKLDDILRNMLGALSKEEYNFTDEVAVHKSAYVENGVTFKKPAIIGKDCTVKAGSYFRNGVYLCSDVGIGANCEIKQSIIFSKSRIAHLNYVGNSIIGNDVNLEAGSVLANHFNEYKNRTIRVVLDDAIVDTGITKFGSLIGDYGRVGANAVLNPGTLLTPGSVVGRLQHVDQLKAST